MLFWGLLFLLPAFPANSAEEPEDDYFVLASYSPVDLLIPNKYGFSFGWQQNADRSWELEYLRGGVSVPLVIEELGKMTDERVSVVGRSYFGKNSFNLSYGISYFGFSLRLGDEFLSRVTAQTYPSMELVEINSLGFNIAMGNRWSFSKNVTVGIDWISWEQPVYLTRKQSVFLDYATHPEGRDAVDRAMKLISYFPRVALFKLQLGISF